MNLLYNVFINEVFVGQVRLLWACDEDPIVRVPGLRLHLAMEQIQFEPFAIFKVL